jgi:TonB-linked SusC/RagA family outer membrane protein
MYLLTTKPIILKNFFTNNICHFYKYVTVGILGCGLVTNSSAFSMPLTNPTEKSNTRHQTGLTTAKATATITGKVTDNRNQPIPGVTVRAKGLSAVTVTDKNGNYTIAVPDEQVVLSFSFIGFVTQEVEVSKNGTVNVVLLEESTGLNEVVVLGYGTQKRRDITGSVASVNVQDLQKAPVRSFEEALAGRVAGVAVSANDGQPGAALNIIIRGNNSLTQNNSPLYVIDDFPIENPDNNVINPADIESMEILKDASATAIYGARGANGVIIIKTKRGKNGEPAITIDSYAGYNQVLKKQELLSPYEFVKLTQQYYPTDSTYLRNTTLDAYKDVKPIDWQGMLEKKGVFQNYNLAIRGGSKTGNYSVSFGSLAQQGVIISSGFNRYSGRVVLDQQIKNNLKLGLNVNYAATKSYGTIVSQYGGSSPLFSLLGSVWAYRPIAGNVTDPNAEQNTDELINEDLDPGVNPTGDFRFNPINNAKNILNNRFANTTIANGYAQYTILKGLVLKVTGGVNNALNETNVFYNSNTFYGNRKTTQGTNGPNGSLVNAKTLNYVNENTLVYDGVLRKDHHLNLLAGYTLQGTKFSSNGYSAIGVPNESFGISGLDEGTAGALNSSSSENRLESFLGRLNYNYKSTYYVTASFRADGSSKFAPENHWSYFPSGAFAWRISNEPFMKPLLSVLSDAKIRASYGKTGNNRVSDYAYLSTITLPLRNSYPFAGVINQGAILAALGNRNLKWETTGTTDIGADLEFLRGRISFSADYYKKITSNLLLNASLPGSTGFTAAYANIGKVQNTGLEFTLNTENIRSKNFAWSSNFNISFNRNKVLALVDGQESLLTVINWSSNGYGTAPSYIAKINQPIAQFYGYIFDGVYQLSDFNKNSSGAYVLKDNIPNNGAVRTTIQPGQIKFKDVNGDGVVDAKDQTVIGNPNPLHTGGFSNTFKYKDFDLNVLLQWSYGNQVQNANRYAFEGGIQLYRNQFASFANRWSLDNQDSNIPNNSGPSVYSTRVIEDGSYMRLKTVQIGYTFSNSLARKLKIKSFRLYASGQNIATLTGYTGPDPEVSTFNSALTPGFDYSAYPKARTLTFGLNIVL